MAYPPISYINDPDLVTNAENNARTLLVALDQATKLYAGLPTAKVNRQEQGIREESLGELQEPILTKVWNICIEDGCFNYLRFCHAMDHELVRIARKPISRDEKRVLSARFRAAENLLIRPMWEVDLYPENIEFLSHFTLGAHLSPDKRGAQIADTVSRFGYDAWDEISFAMIETNILPYHFLEARFFNGKAFDWIEQTLAARAEELRQTQVNGWLKSGFGAHLPAATFAALFIARGMHARYNTPQLERNDEILLFLLSLRVGGEMAVKGAQQAWPVRSIQKVVSTALSFTRQHRQQLDQAEAAGERQSPSR